MKTKNEPILADYRKLSDEDLVYRYAHRHDNTAAMCLFERYGHLVWGTCMKYLNSELAAKEATEQIFMQLLNEMKGESIDHFKPWLYDYTKQFCAAQLHDNKITITKTGFEEERPFNPRYELNPETIEETLTELDKKQGAYLDMFYLQKMNYGQIASETGDSVMQVKEQLQTGKWNLRNKLYATIATTRK